MTVVASIVEGDGEVEALPILLRRLNGWLSPETYVDIKVPIRVRRERFLEKAADFRQHLLLAAAKCGELGWILILLDADDDCPAQLGLEVLRRAKEIVPHRRVSVILAKREYEAWFIAAAESLHGQRGFMLENEAIDPEVPRNAKGWIAKQMVGGVYREKTDQPAFSNRMDLVKAHERSPSFRKLCSEWKKQMV